MIVFHRYQSNFAGIQMHGVWFCIKIRIASTPGTGGQAAGKGRREVCSAGLAKEEAIVGGNRTG